MMYRIDRINLCLLYYNGYQSIIILVDIGGSTVSLLSVIEAAEEIFSVFLARELSVNFDAKNSFYTNILLCINFHLTT